MPIEFPIPKLLVSLHLPRSRRVSRQQVPNIPTTGAFINVGVWGVCGVCAIEKLCVVVEACPHFNIIHF